MDFSWTEEQLAFRQQIVAFAQAELSGDGSGSDTGAVFPSGLWRKCAEFGLLGIATPAQYGGRGADIMTSVLAMEGLGYGCRDNGLAFAVNGQLCIQQPLIHFGSATQQREYLPGMSAGTQLGAFAFSEPEAGSDLYSIRTTAEKDGDHYVLNGSKKFITFAPIADFALVFASTNPAFGKWGLTAFLVDTSTPGIHISDPKEKMGLRCVPMGDIVFDSCRVPAACRLGEEGGGVGILNGSLEWERCCVLASQAGAMERILEDCVDYTRTRKQFDVSIGSFQSVSNRIADMKLRLETSRLLLYKAAWLKKEGKTAMLEAALSKLHLSECFVESSLDAIRIHGGNGYMSDFGIERNLRDAIGGVIYGGTSDVQRNTIARLLGLKLPH